MNEPSIAQQLRASVKLVNPELLAEVPDGYNSRQTFNYLRRNATNYSELFESYIKQYGKLTPAARKALTQGAADVIIAAFRAENEDLLVGKSNTAFSKFSRAIANLLGLGADIDLQAIRDATIALKKSQTMYKSWNERYRRQKEMILKVVKPASPEIRQKVQMIYKANSKDKLDALEKELFNG